MLNDLEDFLVRVSLEEVAKAEGRMRHINIFLSHKGWAVAVTLGVLFVTINLPENPIKQLLMIVVLWGGFSCGFIGLKEKNPQKGYDHHQHWASLGLIFLIVLALFSVFFNYVIVPMYPPGVPMFSW